MGERAGAAAGGASGAFGGNKGEGRKNAGGGVGAILKDKEKMRGIADGLGMLGDQMTPQAPPPSMAPMDMGGGAAAANGDPGGLAAALAARRQSMNAPPVSILDRIRMMRGGY